MNLNSVPKTLKMKFTSCQHIMQTYFPLDLWKLCSEFNIYNWDSSKTHCLWLLKCQERNSRAVRGCVRFWLFIAESKMYFLLGKWEDLKRQARSNPGSWRTHCFPYINSIVTPVRLRNHCGRGSRMVVRTKGQRGLGWTSAICARLDYFIHELTARNLHQMKVANPRS